MREPRAGVTGNQAKKEVIPLAHYDHINRQHDAGDRSDQVQHASRGAAVFRNVERPELSKRFVALLAHDHSLPKLSVPTGSTSVNAKFSSTCLTLLMPTSAVVIPGAERT